MYSYFWGFRSIKAELIFLGVLLFILAVALFCEYRQKRLLERYRNMKSYREQEERQDMGK